MKHYRRGRGGGGETLQCHLAVTRERCTNSPCQMQSVYAEFERESHRAIEVTQQFINVGYRSYVKQHEHNQLL